jgi:ankyrin repeat protein
MPVRHLPVRPDLDQLKHQAKDLLRAIRAGDPEAVAELREKYPDSPDPATVKLADAQLVLARSYDASSWTRLVQSAQLIDAIWRDDLDVVRDLVTRNPKLIHEDARIRKGCNWGPPMSYAANIGRDRIIQMLFDLGARDLEKAIDRATLQSQIETATMLHGLLGNPPLPDGALSGPAYTLSATGTAFALSRGARVHDDNGTLIAPVDVVLETDSRKPAAKHAILALYEQHGAIFPDTAPMAVHRGRIDLLEEHLRRDPKLLTRTFSHREIFPVELGCRDEINATVGTPLGGATLLHMCVDYDEMEMAIWLLDKGMDVNARSAVGGGGFGGYTALFSTVVSQPNFWMNLRQRGPFVAPFTKLLLERGADPNVRASIWKRLHPGYEDPIRYEYRNVTALSWGRRFPHRNFVSEPAMRLIEEAGGVE